MQDRASTANASELPSRLAAAWPPDRWRDVVAAVAVSGGADSVALLRAVHSVSRSGAGRGQLVVLHYDHAARSDSAADADWVRELAGSLGLHAIVERAAATLSPTEEALRNARRDFYRRAAGAAGARFLATGHTADDQAETVLFRLLRGSGVYGLAGIRPLAPLGPDCSLVRPMLGVGRPEVLAYLSSLGQAWRADSTNSDVGYTRNWVRNELLPLAEQRIPASRQSLVAFSEQAAELAETLQQLAEQALDEATEGDSPWRVRRSVLAACPRLVVSEVVRLVWRRSGWPEQAMTAASWRRLAEMASSPSELPAETFPGAIRAEAIGEHFVLSP